MTSKKKDTKFELRARRFVERRRQTLRIIVPTLVLFIVMVGVLVSEIGKRNEVFSYIEAEISSIGRESANAIANSSDSVAHGATDAFKLREFRRLREQIRLISLQGETSSSDNMRRLQLHAFCIVESPDKNSAEKCRTVGIPNEPAQTEANCTPGENFGLRMAASCISNILLFPYFVMSAALSPFMGLRSEALLAVAVVLSGAIGAIGQSLVKARLLSSLSIVIGVFSGFFTYLLIRGGRSFLLTELSIPGEAIVNPYSMVLLGLAIGYIAPVVFEEFEERVERLVLSHDNDSPSPDKDSDAQIRSGGSQPPAPDALNDAAAEADKPSGS